MDVNIVWYNAMNEEDLQNENRQMCSGGRRKCRQTGIQGEEPTDVFENGELLRDESEEEAEGDVSPSNHPNFRVIHHRDSEKGSMSSVDSHQDSLHQWSGAVTVGGKHYFLDLRDAHCQEAFDNIRPEVYTDTDVFLVCFSVVRSPSWENALNKWIPEIQHHRPVTPFILVGTQTEWRELWDERTRRKNRFLRSQEPVMRSKWALLSI
ncbi:hypothetical protein ACROYT_G023444 [Oculina patagonica]